MANAWDFVPKVVQDLISRGADLYARCRWTQMTPVHYAALFDSAAIMRILLNVSHAIDIDSPCNEYENGSALHIAAAHLAVNSTQILVEFGASTKMKDSLGRTPFGKSISFLPMFAVELHSYRYCAWSC